MRFGATALLILDIVTIISSLEESANNLCLDRCKCFKEKFLADCSDRNLDEVPKNIPSYGQDVNLALNKIKFLGSRLFYKGFRLVKLDLSSNAIDEISHDAFLNVRHTLTTLTLRGNRFKKIPQSALSQLALLEELSLANNELDVLNTRSFEKVLRLKRLDLSGNWLEQISPNAFFGLQNLLHIDLSRNKLSALSASTLRNLNSLTYLDLSKNDIMKLHPSCFTHTPFIEVLLLAENKIESMQVGTSAELGRLRVLDLSSNNFTELTKDVFKGLKKLKKLDISKNRIEKIFEEIFLDLRNLKCLDISKNKLEEIPGSRSWKGLYSLQELLLSGNNIVEVQPMTFGRKEGSSEMQDITYIDLSKNNLTKISPTAFSSVIGLQKLNLAKNYLRQIPGDTFIYNLNLEELYLNYNLLQTPNFSWFRGNMHPTTHNVLELSSFLDGNPWKCDCTLYNQANLYLSDTGRNSTALNGLKCSEPIWLKGRSFTWFLEAEASRCERTIFSILKHCAWLAAFFSFFSFMAVKKAYFFQMFTPVKTQIKRNRHDSFKRDKIL